MSSAKIQLSESFKREATKAILMLTLFVLTYFVILLLAVALTVFSIIGGFAIILAKPMVFTILIGIGLCSLGIFVLIFLLKFIFTSTKTDRSHLIEIFPHQQPELFNIIESVAKEVNTSLPKKVYVSADVNASVFYDSNFWSMFLPIQKNLQIGLGLVNTVTRSELKAILAHEFGHFSQSTMKVGSYIYNINLIIHNMLYENKSYEELAGWWGSISGFFMLFVNIAIKINQGIQWILIKLYEFANKQYMSLSREMEFHADLIAASVTGSSALKTSLMRLPVSQHAFDTVLNYYDENINNNIRSKNVYKDQHRVLYLLASINQLPLANGFPQITLEYQNRYDKSKLVIKDQWASHPTLVERITNLDASGFTDNENDHRPAIELFSDANQIQEMVTEHVFKPVAYKGQIRLLESEKLAEDLQEDFLKSSFPSFYNGYYDSHPPHYFEETTNPYPITPSLQDLFAAEKIDLIYESNSLDNDLHTLENIANGNIPVKTFDYAGTRYYKKQAQKLLVDLQKKQEQLKLKIKDNDKLIFTFFRNNAISKNSITEFESYYKKFEKNQEKVESQFTLYAKIQEGIQFTQFVTPTQEIEFNFKSLRAKEDELKIEIKILLEDPVLLPEISNDIKQTLEKYVSNTLLYFVANTYQEENMNLLMKSLKHYAFLISRKHFLIKKSLLQFQESLVLS
ncbi:MAG: M48 family metallopeptidase [Chryseotalea sp.]